MNSLAFTLKNGQSVKAGADDFTKSHIFDSNKKITKVDVLVSKDETLILQINFYSGYEKLVMVGFPDWQLRELGCRNVESFAIADEEQLIGCILDEGFDQG
jgi:hypothetical protein